MKLLSETGAELPMDRLLTYQQLAVYPGSFNPLHQGHRGIHALLTRQGYHVVFEMSKSRYQKPSYSKEQFDRLIAQFKGFAELLISDAPLFSQKRDQLITFNPYWVMGYDTAKRWIYENNFVDEAEKEKIAAMKVIFIGRLSRRTYCDPRDLLDGSEHYEHQIYDFRCDISSTELRENS